MSNNDVSAEKNRLIQANMKLQDMNKELKFSLNEYKNLVNKIKTYIQINKDKDNKINANNILEIMGEYYE